MNKNKQNVCNMTEGNVTQLLVQFALPLLIGNIFQQFYNVVDTIIVGRYVGANALAAVGSLTALMFLLFSLCTGMATGIGVLIAQYFGAGNKEDVQTAIGNSIYITLFCGVLMSGVSIVFADQIVVWMHAPDEIIVDAATYLKIVGGGTIIVAIYNSISAILRALGDSKTPLIFLVVASVINVVLDLLFVLRFDWGVAGVAWATLIAQGVAAFGSIGFAILKNEYFKLKVEHLKYQYKFVKETMKLGIPLAMQNALVCFSCVILQSAINGFGANVVAAFAATAKIEQFVQLPYGTIGISLSTFVGQNYGAGKYERIKEGFFKSVKIVLGISVAVLVLLQLVGQYLVRIFITDVEIIGIGADGLRVVSCFYFALGMIHITRGLLNGVGDANYALGNGILEVVSRLICVGLMLTVLSGQAWFIWMTNGVAWTVTSSAGTIRYLRGKWRKNNVKRSEVDMG